MDIKRIIPSPGQESVWDYPRPPRVEPSDKHIQVVFNGLLIVDTINAFRVLETSHPPVYYLPQKDILMAFLRPTEHKTSCEWKGLASYFSIIVKERTAVNAAWTYLSPKENYGDIRNCIAFYPGAMDLCLVNDEVVLPQQGDFYGGWITSDIVGPFKGEIGSLNW